MNVSREFNERIASKIKVFLGDEPNDRLALTLDGFGVNSALQYSVLSYLGTRRLSEFAEINVISGSTYAWFCFCAFHSQLLLPTELELEGWDKTQLRLTQIRPGVSAVRVVFGQLFQSEKFLIPTERLADSLEYLVHKSVVDTQIKNLQKNLRFWLYDIRSKKLVVVSPDSDMNDMTVRELIQAAPSVPGVFRPLRYRGMELIDPVYSPKRGELYASLKIRPFRHLISNPKSESDFSKDVGQGSEARRVFYLKPHPFVDGKKMLSRDLTRFILGLRNPSINLAISNGLFNRELGTI